MQSPKPTATQFKIDDVDVTLVQKYGAYWVIVTATGQVLGEIILGVNQHMGEYYARPNSYGGASRFRTFNTIEAAMKYLFNKDYFQTVYIDKSPGRASEARGWGYGLFAGRPIKKGETISFPRQFLLRRGEMNAFPDGNVADLKDDGNFIHFKAIRNINQNQEIVYANTIEGFRKVIIDNPTFDRRLRIFWNGHD